MFRIIPFILLLAISSISVSAQKSDPFENYLKVEPAISFEKLDKWESDAEVTEDMKQRYEEARTFYNNEEYARAHSHFQYLYKTSFQAVELYEYLGIIELMIEKGDMGQANFLAYNNSIVDGDADDQCKAIWLLAYSVYKQGMEKSAVKALEMLGKLDAKNDYTESAPKIIRAISR